VLPCCHYASSESGVCRAVEGAKLAVVQVAEVQLFVTLLLSIVLQVIPPPRTRSE
jgi:hypothetical protein